MGERKVRRYELSQVDQVRFERRASWSALAEPAKFGHFRLFNKNNGTTLHVELVDQVPNAAIWIVECAEPIPPYFQHVLRPRVRERRLP